MKYRCTHCDHICELGDREFKRCPSCFWTTSLVSLDGGQTQPVPSKKEIIEPIQTNIPSRKINFAPLKQIFFLILLAVFIGGLGYVIYQSKGQFKKLNFKLPESQQKINPSPSRKTPPKYNKGFGLPHPSH